MGLPAPSEVQRKPKSFRDRALIAGLALFSVLLAVIAVLSAEHEILWDGAYFHRLAYLIFERDCAPYRDVFDINMFGVYFVHGFVGQVFGYGDRALQIFGLVWLAALSCSTYLLLRKINWLCGWAAAAVFAWLYLNQHFTQRFQREFLYLLPISISSLMIFTPEWPARFRSLRPLLIGGLFGMAASLKPNAAAGLPVALFFEYWVARDPAEQHGVNKPRLAKLALWAGLGFVLPLLAGLGWVWMRGGLNEFIRVVTEGWPIYARLWEMLNSVPEEERAAVRLRSMLTFSQFLGQQWLFFPAGLGAAALLLSPESSPRQRQLTWYLLALLTMYTLQVYLMSQFHPYSWLPTLYFLVLLTALGLSGLKPGKWPLAVKVVPVAAVFCLIFACNNRIEHRYAHQLFGSPAKMRTKRRVEHIAGFLNQHLQPHETVQPFDALGGCDRALTFAKAMNATAITNELFLTLNVQEPLVMDLRQKFLETLKTKPPRFVIFVTSMRVPGMDPLDDGSFRREIQAWVESHYAACEEGDGFVIFERKAGARNDQ